MLPLQNAPGLLAVITKTLRNSIHMQEERPESTREKLVLLQSDRV